jgi:hypothetical protein
MDFVAEFVVAHEKAAHLSRREVRNSRTEAGIMP